MHVLVPRGRQDRKRRRHEKVIPEASEDRYDMVQHSLSMFECFSRVPGGHNDLFRHFSHKIAGIDDSKQLDGLRRLSKDCQSICWTAA